MLPAVPQARRTGRFLCRLRKQMVCKGFSMNIWVVNCGSSSLKFQLIGKNAGPDAEQVLAQGVIERIGGQALLTFHAKGTKTKRTAPLRDVRQALNAWLRNPDRSTRMGVRAVMSVLDAWRESVAGT